MTDKKNASPELTGGAGSTYECRVVALYLSYLILEGMPRGVQNGVCKKVSVQRASIDAPLDDIKITVLRNDGEICKFDAQIKRSLTISSAVKNINFRDIILNAWKTVKKEEFNKGIDRVSGITDDISKTSFRKFRQLTEAARYSHNENEFIQKINTLNNYSKEVRNYLSDIKKIIKRKDGVEPSHEEVWLLLKHFVLLQIDVMGEGAKERDFIIENLRLALPKDQIAENLFNTLEVIARDMSAVSGSVDKACLEDNLAGRFAMSSPSLNIINILPDFKYAAQLDLDGFFNESYIIKNNIFIDIEIKKDNKYVALEYFEALELIKNKENILIEAEPGTGKSTTLLNISQIILDNETDIVPIIIPLPQLAISKQGIIQTILNRNSFTAFTEEKIRVLASKGSIVLMLDGWNELSAEQREFMRNEMDTFIRDFPNTSIIFSTRPNTTNFSLKKLNIIHLLPLTRKQQLEYVKSHLGEDGVRLFEKARKVPGIINILKIPFYLNVLCEIGVDGNVPDTKEMFINEFICNYENNLIHKEKLNTILEGEQKKYLSNIGKVLTECKTTIISGGELKKILSEVGEELKKDGYITEVPNLNEVISVLHNHHIMVCHPQDEHYDFQHQQFQEWYASFYVEDLIFKLEVENDKTHAELYEKILNYSFWEESIFFSIERLSMI